MLRSTPSLAETQQTIRQLVAELRQVDDQLAQLSSALPEPTNAWFDARAELRGAVDCVRVVLLADALDTLTKAVAGSHLELRMGYELRLQLWLAKQDGVERERKHREREREREHRERERRHALRERK